MHDKYDWIAELGQNSLKRHLWLLPSILPSFYHRIDCKIRCDIGITTHIMTAVVGSMRILSYVGTIKVRREVQAQKARNDITTREVGKVRSSIAGSPTIIHPEQ